MVLFVIFSSVFNYLIFFSSYFSSSSLLRMMTIWTSESCDFFETCKYFFNMWITSNLSLFWNLRGGGVQAYMKTSQCLSYRSLEERREGLEAFQRSRGIRKRRRRMMMRRRRLKGRGKIRRRCRTAWCWKRAGWSTYPCYPYHLSFPPAVPAIKLFFPRRTTTTRL